MVWCSVKKHRDNFTLTTTCAPVMGPTQWVPVILSLGLKRQEREDENLPTSCKIKVKIKFSLWFFNWIPRHEGVLGEWRYSSMHFFTSALDGGEWSASRPSRFTPRERAPGTHWIWGWVDPTAGLETVVKRRIPNHCRNLNPPSSGL
jgi:hypothetical protein